MIPEELRNCLSQQELCLIALAAICDRLGIGQDEITMYAIECIKRKADNTKL